jgi:AraC family ethanolamine operon transcriptional activator
LPGFRKWSSVALEVHGANNLTVRQLCRDTDASERTLQYAFKERFEMGPKAFLQAWRLNGVRRDLSGRSRLAETISDIANNHGFWHMGQFAADYRRQFGELPSDTLDRAIYGDAPR